MNRRVYFIALLAIAAAGLTWFFQSREIEHQKEFAAAARERATRLEHQLTDLQRQRDDALRSAVNDERDLQSLTSATDDSATDVDARRARDARTWLAQAKRLRQSFTDNPTQSIPELKLLTDLDWLTIARTLSDGSDLGLRKARSAARTLAIRRFARPLAAALRDYTAAHAGDLPGDVILLLPYFAPPIDPELLQRYTMTAAGNIRTMRREAIAERSPVDEEFDQRTAISATGNVSSRESWAHAIFDNAAFKSTDDYALVNDGQKPKTAEDLLPYINDPVLRPIFAAIVEFRKNQSKQTYRYLDLKPYVTEPSASAFLEKLILAEQKTPPSPP